MAMRIRKDGRMFCARYHKAEDGDLYIPDDIHAWLTGADGLVELHSILVYNKETHEWFFRKDKSMKHRGKLEVIVMRIRGGRVELEARIKLEGGGTYVLGSKVLFEDDTMLFPGMIVEIESVIVEG